MKVANSLPKASFTLLIYKIITLVVKAVNTFKEAYGKALGVGIRYYLNEVDLFSCPSSSRFSTLRAGLFKETNKAAMPDWLHGLQIRMPFPAVAALMYSVGNGQTGNPQVQGKQL